MDCADSQNDRGYALQQAKPVMLRSSIHKPQVLCSEDPILAYGFINLINIFEKLTPNLYDWLSAGGGDGVPERPPTSAIQSSLCKPVVLDGMLEIQQVDILVTQQWLQAMMWKLSMSRATQPGSRDEAVLPFHLPVLVGKAVMSVIGTASQGAVDAHGIGMVRSDNHNTAAAFTYANSVGIGAKAIRHGILRRRRDALPRVEEHAPAGGVDYRPSRTALGDSAYPLANPRLAIILISDTA